MTKITRYRLSYATAFALALAASLGGCGSANAQMPPSTYDGPVGGRVVAQATCTFGNLDAGHVALPRLLGIAGALVAGQYVNPTSCKVEGAPAGPAV